ncbi:MAG: hypothetical protein R6U70_04090 [Bacillota bacterium]
MALGVLALRESCGLSAGRGVLVLALTFIALGFAGGLVGGLVVVIMLR